MDSRLNDAPLISVVVLNYKRRDALLRCVRSVLAQRYTRREVIVVDNHSEDGSEQMVRAIEPGIEWIGLPQNLGSCTGRNAGLRVARGEYIVTLDNDVMFASESALDNLIVAFGKHPEAGVLAFQVCDEQTGRIRNREWCHPKNMTAYGEDEFETSFFPEGAVAFRKTVLNSAGLYYERFFIGCEGGDLAIRILDHGFRIMYCPSVRVFHSMEPATRTTDRPYYFYTRNYTWIAFKDYPIVAGLRYLLPKLGMMAYFSVRTGKLWSFFRGLKDAIIAFPQVRTERKPVSPSTVTYFRSLEKERPSWIARFARHRLQPQI